MGVHGGPDIVEDGLVFAVDAGNSQSYVSASLNTFSLVSSDTGSIHNDVDFSSTNQGSWVFDGVDDGIDCGNSNNLDITSKITISAWINPTTAITSQNFPMFIAKDLNVAYMLYGNSSTGAFRLRIGTNTAANVVDSVTTLSTGVWAHIVGTYDGTNMKLYINGSLDITKSRVGTIPTSTNSLRIAEANINNNEYEGNIASVKIYNKALTSAEVTQNYNATKERFI